MTDKLDNMDIEHFNREVLYEIILWKLNRFPSIDDDILSELKNLSNLQQSEHRKAKDTLKKLLACNGIRLPTASTILRFINPNVF